MLYYLFEYLQSIDVPGAGVFRYLTFRTAMAIVFSLLITLVFGKTLIRMLRKKQVGESVRDLGLTGQKEKEGTPTMGGIIILTGILVPTLLFAQLDNIYVILLLITTVWLGTIGFLDDYIKVFKKNKKGLAGKFKIIGQIGLGIIAGSILYFHPNIVAKEKTVEYLENGNPITQSQYDEKLANDNPNIERKVTWQKTDDYITTIPFFKNNELNYDKSLQWLGNVAGKYTWLIFIPLVIVVITGVSNGANLTDGLDGLATGTSSIIAATLGIFAYVSGNYIFADYLDIMYIPNVGELVIYIGAFIGACVGFLWYNSYPATVFMGDTGSLSLGGIIAVFALVIRKELLIPLLCGIFLIENLSVIGQVAYFKYTKKRTGVGKRILLMAPLHHHYQKKGVHESKIVSRFWIVGITLAVITIVTLKLR